MTRKSERERSWASGIMCVRSSASQRSLQRHTGTTHPRASPLGDGGTGSDRCRCSAVSSLAPPGLVKLGNCQCRTYGIFQFIIMSEGSASWSYPVSSWARVGDQPHRSPVSTPTVWAFRVTADWGTSRVPRVTPGWPNGNEAGRLVLGPILRAASHGEARLPSWPGPAPQSGPPPCR